MNSTQDLRRTIDRVAENAAVQMEATERERYLRSRFGSALAMIALVPVAAVVLQLVRILFGLPAGVAFSTPWLIGLSLAFPVVWWLACTLLHRTSVTRQRALGSMDQRLSASERLVTADQFLSAPQRDAFMDAAIEDATDWALQARGQSIAVAPYRWTTGRMPLATIPLALLAIWTHAWLAEQQRAGVSLTDSAVAITETADQIAATPAEPRIPPPEQEVELKTDQPSKPPRSDRRPEKRTNRKNTASVVTPDDVEQSEGRLADGETSQSQQASNPSSARGDPSSSGQPSKSETQSTRKSKKETKPRDRKDQPRRERKEQEQPSGSTAGQGSSRGSNNTAAPSEWSSKSQTATPDNEDLEDEEDVDDEDEEQKSRGGVQPNMRDRRTPVNRDLQIGFGNQRPNPDANGRGGPGGQKKSRGVASLVLGVPIPDRVTGQPNKGRIRITQQRITPEAEQSDVVDAEDRGVRIGSVGPIAQFDFEPWLQQLVRRYFLERRSTATLQSDSAKSSATTLDQTQTSQTNPIESDSPQS